MLFRSPRAVIGTAQTAGEATVAGAAVAHTALLSATLLSSALRTAALPLLLSTALLATRLPATGLLLATLLSALLTTRLLTSRLLTSGLLTLLAIAALLVPRSVTLTIPVLLPAFLGPRQLFHFTSHTLGLAQRLLHGDGRFIVVAWLACSGGTCGVFQFA